MAGKGTSAWDRAQVSKLRGEEAWLERRRVEQVQLARVLRHVGAVTKLQRAWRRYCRRPPRPAAQRPDPQPPVFYGPPEPTGDQLIEALAHRNAAERELAMQSGGSDAAMSGAPEQGERCDHSHDGEPEDDTASESSGSSSPDREVLEPTPAWAVPGAAVVAMEGPHRGQPARIKTMGELGARISFDRGKKRNWSFFHWRDLRPK